MFYAGFDPLDLAQCNASVKIRDDRRRCSRCSAEWNASHMLYQKIMCGQGRKSKLDKVSVSVVATCERECGCDCISPINLEVPGKKPEAGAISRGNGDRGMQSQSRWPFCQFTLASHSLLLVQQRSSFTFV
jgi:hypothetical protein